MYWKVLDGTLETALPSFLLEINQDYLTEWTKLSGSKISLPTSPWKIYWKILNSTLRQVAMKLHKKFSLGLIALCIIIFCYSWKATYWLACHKSTSPYLQSWKRQSLIGTFFTWLTSLTCNFTLLTANRGLVTANEDLVMINMRSTLILF